jgi:hypothetical protein
VHALSAGLLNGSARILQAWLETMFKDPAFKDNLSNETKAVLLTR